MAIEAVYGWQTNSLALLADAGHNLSDVAGLFLAWAAWGAGKLRPDRRHSFGWRKASVLASLANALLLLLAMGALAWEAAHRFNQPTPMHSVTVMAVAACGVVVNAVTAWLFAAGQKHDLNLRGAFMHMAADALVSLGVVIAGALSLWKGWLWLDPVVSLLIAAVIVVGTWSLFRQSVHLLFDGVPEGITLDAVNHALQALDGVAEVHDLHVWGMSTSENALMAHLVLSDEGASGDALLSRATALLHERFNLSHVTLQLEGPGYAARCPTARCAHHAASH